jgi:hypothetical protein
VPMLTRAQPVASAAVSEPSSRILPDGGRTRRRGQPGEPTAPHRLATPARRQAARRTSSPTPPHLAPAAPPGGRPRRRRAAGRTKRGRRAPRHANARLRRHDTPQAGTTITNRPVVGSRRVPAGQADRQHQHPAPQSVRGASAVHPARRPIRTLGFKVCRHSTVVQQQKETSGKQRHRTTGRPPAPS